MAVPGEPYDDPIEPFYADLAATLPPGTAWFDVHTHMGRNDPDGFRCTADEVVACLDRAGHAQALVFPMQEPDGYPAANDRVLAEAEASGGRLRALCRLDPHARPDARGAALPGGGRAWASSCTRGPSASSSRSPRWRRSSRWPTSAGCP